ncbi:hypothetical protein CCP4SC76_1840001 [Gammaproteobacteria bacterium]
MKEFAHSRVLGAMAFLQADAGAEAMVIKQGLFAIHATGDGAYIVNPRDFKPRAW